LCQNPPQIWLNASSATIYDHAEEFLNTEANGIIGDDFSMNVCKTWEATFFDKATPKTRKVALRTSIVLGNGGGAFPKLKLVSRLGLGGSNGTGKQKVSWLHEDDFCRAVEFIINQPEIEGVVNLTAPNPVSNKEFMSVLRKKLHIPFGLPSPKLMLEVASFFIRTETELLLKSRNVYPKRLLDAGFEFNSKTINECFEKL
jgi:uncharacterized protein